MKELIDYANQFVPKTTCTNTFHQFENLLPENAKKAFHVLKEGTIMERLRTEYPGHTIHSVDPMNEVYIACIGGSGSDRVFETVHIDGPYYGFPFCTVLRVASWFYKEIQVL